MKIQKFAVVWIMGCSLVFGIFGGTSQAENFLDLFQQANFALKVENWERAVALFSKSIAVNPKSFVAYHNRAVAYSKKGDYDKSVADLKKAVELKPDYPDAYGLMGLVYEIKKDYPSSLNAYEKALSLEKRPKVRKVIEIWISDLKPKINKKRK